MNLLDTDLNFPASGRFKRLRARKEPDLYNPRQMVANWNNPDELLFSGFLASSSSVMTQGQNDVATASTAVLTTQPTTDIQVGDRIVCEPDDGRAWTVSGFPARDRNPFTGWQPSLECTLTEYRG